MFFHELAAIAQRLHIRYSVTLPSTDRGITWSGVSRTSPSPQLKHTLPCFSQSAWNSSLVKSPSAFSLRTLCRASYTDIFERLLPANLKRWRRGTPLTSRSGCADARTLHIAPSSRSGCALSRPFCTTCSNLGDHHASEGAGQSDPNPSLHAPY